VPSPPDPSSTCTPTVHFGAPISLTLGDSWFKNSRWMANSWNMLTDWVWVGGPLCFCFLLSAVYFHLTHSTPR
jgi:hypothetical protein